MSYLHDAKNPRHARMFELLRQTQQASRTTQRLRVTSLNGLDTAVAQKIMENAVQSLRSPVRGTRPPGR